MRGENRYLNHIVFRKWFSSGFMAAQFLKQRILFGACLMALALGGAALSYFVAGMHIAASDLSGKLEQITGRRLMYRSEPVVGVFPTLTAELKDVAFYNSANTSNQFPVFEAKTMRLSFSVLAALKGEARITAVILETPVFHAKAANNAWQIPLSDQAALAKLVAAISAGLSSTLTSAKTIEARNGALGSVIIHDGTIVLVANGDKTGNSSDLITNIEGVLNWPVSGQQASLKADFKWQGAAAKITAKTTDLVLLAAGVETAIEIALEAPVLTSRFKGNVRLLPAPYVEGELYSKTNSLLQASQWIAPHGFALTSLNGEKPPIFLTMGMTISGALKGDADQWQLENTQLQLGTNKGSGGLIFQPNMTTPLLSGTLDFENLDLALLPQIFDPAAREQQSKSKITLAADMRISADSASFGTLSFNKVAASLQITDQTNTLDIHNASAFGGTLQMALKSQNDPQPETELRILANGIETKALETLAGPIAMLPQARGSLSAILRGKSKFNSQFLESAIGTIKLRLGAGTIPGINANQMIAALRQGGFFSLAAEPPSALSFTDFTADAKLENGTLQFDPVKVGLDKAGLTLNGTYAIKEQSLALTGQLNLDAGHAEALNNAETINVFFGGNRNAPLMSAISSTPATK